MAYSKYCTVKTTVPYFGGSISCAAQSDKQNQCCVCGSGGEYLRHSVVPHCYRQHFPPSMKSHLSHDIVLMCPPCHKVAGAGCRAR